MSSQNSLFKLDTGTSNQGLTRIEIETSDITEIIEIENGTLLAGTRTNGVFVSDDGGENWTGTWPAQIPFNRVSHLYENDGVIYLGILGSGIFRASSNTIDWSSVTNSDLDLLVNHLSIQQNRLFAATSSGLYLYDSSVR